MTLARWQSTIVDTAGNILPSAQVTVRREIAGAPLAVLYEDRDGATLLGNPFSADLDGFAAFHVIGGAYRIDVVSGAYSRTYRYVGVGLASEGDGAIVDVAYVFSDETADSDPGAGIFRFNNATLASVTQVYFDNLDDAGADVTAWLDRLDNAGPSTDHGTLIIRSIDGAAEFVATVTGSVVDGTGYRKVSVTPLATVGAFDIERVSVSFSPRGTDGLSPGLPFTFSSTTSMADPGSGNFRLNNATLSSVTAAAFSDDSAATGSPDVSAAVLSWDDSTNLDNRGTLTIKSTVSPENFAIYRVSGASTDNTGWTQLALTYVTHAGSFSDADDCSVEFSATADKVTAGFRNVADISGGDTIVASDSNKLVNIASGTGTLAFEAAATLGSSFACTIKNSGSGDVTLNPDGAELIDGLSSWILYPGGSIKVYCDGSALYSVLLSPMRVTFNSSGTFTKPGAGSVALVEAWGAGGSGGRGDTNVAGGGAGGGAYARHVMPLSSLGTTETVTVGTGGAAKTTNTAGDAGGNSTFGSLVTGYGGGGGAIGAGGNGGGGGGSLSAGSGNIQGGQPLASTSAGAFSSGFSGGNGNTVGGLGGWSHAGGGGGGGGDAATGGAGGSSYYGGGGGGGGGDTTAGGASGSSTYGGAGGAGATGASNAAAGTQPGGGGGGSETGNSGAGGNGRVTVTVS